MINAREVIPDDLNPQSTAREDVQMRIGKRLLNSAISRYFRERNPGNAKFIAEEVGK